MLYTLTPHFLLKVMVGISKATIFEGSLDLQPASCQGRVVPPTHLEPLTFCDPLPNPKVLRAKEEAVEDRERIKWAREEEKRALQRELEREMAAWGLAPAGGEKGEKGEAAEGGGEGDSGAAGGGGVGVDGSGASDSEGAGAAAGEQGAKAEDKPDTEEEVRCGRETSGIGPK